VTPPAPPSGNLVNDFRQFLLRGNVVDLAVGIVIGAAFGRIVSTVVSGLITPIIAAIGGMQSGLRRPVVHDQRQPLPLRPGHQRDHLVPDRRDGGVLRGGSPPQCADEPVSHRARPDRADPPLSGVPERHPPARATVRLVRRRR
jgi:hypothetical protein